MVRELGEATVLVIDDEEIMCEGCRQTPEQGGFQTRTATDGMLGVRIADLVIDLDRPLEGSLNASQAALESLLSWMQSGPF